MIIRSILCIIATIIVLFGASGTPTCVSKAQSYGRIAPKPHKKAIIFDLGEVLITTNTFAAFYQLCIPEVLYYIAISGNTKLKRTLYSFMEKVEPTNPHHPATLDQDEDKVPELFHRWLAGIQSPQEIKVQLLTAIDEHPEWFAYEVERRIVRRMVHMLFTPELFAKTRKLIDGAVEFVQECKDRGHKVYILSNWDNESIHHVKARFPELFDLFDGICISGEEQCTKPDLQIYARLLQKHDLKSSDCWFIDDQKNNIASALSCGIAGMICPQKGLISHTTDFDALRYQLI